MRGCTTRHWVAALPKVFLCACPRARRSCDRLSTFAKLVGPCSHGIGTGTIKARALIALLPEERPDGLRGTLAVSDGRASAGHRG